MRKSAFALLAGLALVMVSAPAWGQGVCSLTGTAHVTPGLGLEPGVQEYRFDGTLGDTPAGTCPCAGAVLVSVGTLDPGTCAANAHAGAYAIFDSVGGDCNVGSVEPCDPNDPNSPKCPTGDANLSGVCAGAVCAGGDGDDSTYNYAIVFNDERDAAVIEDCVANAPGGPASNGPIFFSGIITR